MIWHSILSILWALVRNALQKGHQCILLEQETGWGWVWECSCGNSGVCHNSEVEAIQGFSAHVNNSPKASRRFWESVSIEGLVRK